MTSAKLLKSSLVLVFIQLIPISTWGLTQEQARKELEKQNIRFNRNGFVESAARGDMATVELFLSAGMKPNVRNREGRTALIQAAREGHVAAVKTLVDERIGGHTALMIAAEKGHVATVKVLLSHGARVNAVKSHFFL